MNGSIRRRPVLLILISACVLCTFGFLVPGDSDYFMRVKRSIETFGRVYQEIAVNYVDEVDPDEFMRAGIDGMLNTLDPYTVFMDEQEGDELELVTSGRYGGIGVSIGVRDGMVTIINLIDGYSAAKQGIEVGDRILEIDTTKVTGASLEDVRQLVRGAPGTEVRVTVEREGEPKPMTFTLVREEIPVRNVTYSGFVKPGIALVRLERFSRTAGDDLRSALKDLQSQQPLRGVVLDLRNNPGGLLDVAVDVVAKFVPESSLVVSTRGRRTDAERKYRSAESPLLPSVPLAVLVNGYSASASEIVAGAVQDLDRGVLVGTRTFGKGFVQTVSRITETSTLKVTTARYYTPSGRCIQEMDYRHRGKDGAATAVPDSLRKEFRTLHHRRVREAGGIQPDTVVTDTLHSRYLDALARRAMFFKYANRFAATTKTIPDDFVVTDPIIEDFEKFLKTNGFEYEEQGEEQIRNLRTTAVQSRYGKEFITELDSMEGLLRKEKARQIHRYHEEVRIALRTEIVGRIKGEKRRIESTFANDRQLQTAIGVLESSKLYGKLLEAER